MYLRVGSSPIFRIVKRERLKREIVWVFSFSEAGASLDPRVQGLRSASAGAKQTSTGRLAPHLPLCKNVIFCYTAFGLKTLANASAFSVSGVTE